LNPWLFNACTSPNLRTIANMPPCTDRAHHLGPRPAGVPPFPVGNGGVCNVNRARCENGHNHTVCDTCRTDTKRLLRFIPAGAAGATNRNRIGDLNGRTPPVGSPEWRIPTPAGTANHPWPGFLTPVCDHCELMIQSERRLRAAGQMPFPQDGNRRQVCPSISCKCRKDFGVTTTGPRVCFPHQQLNWNRLVAKKDANDAWLRNAAYSASGPVQAEQADKTRRDQEGTYRACRCGRDVPPAVPTAAAPVPHQPEVWLCMACEGFMSVVNAGPPSRWHMNWLAPGWLRNRYRLGRPLRTV